MEHIGTVTAETRLRLGPIDLPLDELRDAYENGLPRILERNSPDWLPPDQTAGWGLTPAP